VLGAWFCTRESFSPIDALAGRFGGGVLGNDMLTRVSNNGAGLHHSRCDLLITYRITTTSGDHQLCVADGYI